MGRLKAPHFGRPLGPLHVQRAPLINQPVSSPAPSYTVQSPHPLFQPQVLNVPVGKLPGTRAALPPAHELRTGPIHRVCSDQINSWLKQISDARGHVHSCAGARPDDRISDLFGICNGPLVVSGAKGPCWQRPKVNLRRQPQRWLIDAEPCARTGQAKCAMREY